MKPVIQQETTGCAIASTAALTNVSYAAANNVARKLGITAEDRALLSDTAYIRQLLQHYKIVTDNTETAFTH